MSIFSSKTPRDLNRDPLPWSVGDPRDGRALRSQREVLVPVEWCEFDPRPEYDHAQHNEPNPILVDARVYFLSRRSMNSPKGWAHVLRKVDYALATSAPWADATQEHAIHARKVLARLARLESLND